MSESDARVGGSYEMESNGTLIGIDLFSGAGGLSLGAHWAGVDVRYAVELWPYAARTYKRNNPRAEVICDDIQRVSAADFVGKDEKVFIVMGGPPCQGFSLSNTKSRNMDNPKNLLFREFVRIVREVNPEWFLLENVWGMTKMNNGETLEMIKACFREIGYQVESRVLWADEYGVPQRRMRLFLVGNNRGIDFEFPKPHDQRVTVEEAIGDLPPLANGAMVDELPYAKSLAGASPYARTMRHGSSASLQNFVSRSSDLVVKRYAYIGQGQNWRAIPDELMRNYSDKSRCHSGIYKRLRADKPSVVISNYRKSMLIHPHQDRGLSVREAARLQSFPDTFVFEGPHMSIQQQIGNAVPPLLAKAVVEQIIVCARKLM